jgi:beta-mannosidase
MQWYYRPEVEPQALSQVKRMIFHLGSHPCIGLWCMHNKPFRAFDLRERYRFGSLSRALATFLIWNQNRERMDKELARKARFLDPTRFVTESSGERGLGRESGDVHYYYGWYFGPLKWFHNKYRKSPQSLKFITEFGSQSFPNLDSAKKFMADSLDKVDWKKLERRHHYQGFFMRKFVDPKKHKTLESFIRATQDYQSELNRFYIDRVRSLKYKPNGGCVAFLLLDSNPAVQWSVIDYWRAPKSSYFALQKAMSPVYAFTILEKSSYKLGEIVVIPVFAVNDTWEEVKVDVGLAVTSPVGDAVLDQSFERALSADCEAVALGNPELKLRWAGTYQVKITLHTESGRLENRYELKVK